MEDIELNIAIEEYRLRLLDEVYEYAETLNQAIRYLIVSHSPGGYEQHAVRNGLGYIHKLSRIHISFNILKYVYRLLMRETLLESLGKKSTQLVHEDVGYPRTCWCSFCVSQLMKEKTGPPLKEQQ